MPAQPSASFDEGRAARSPGPERHEGASLRDAFEAAFRTLVDEAERADKSLSRLSVCACGDLSVAFRARCSVGLRGKGHTLLLQDVEEVRRQGVRLPPVDIGMGATRHGLGIWTAARTAMEDLLAAGVVSALSFEEVPNRLVRESLAKRGYEGVDEAGRRDRSYRADRDTPVRVRPRD